MGTFFRRLGRLLRRTRLDQDLNDEVAFHLEMRAAEHREAGVGSNEAEKVAHRQFGNVSLVKERAREAWAFSYLEDLIQDTRHALRGLRRNPAFGTVVILTLALGIGLTTAVFSVFRAVMLRPLDYPNPDRLVWLTLSGGGLPAGQERVSSLDFLDWQEQSVSFDHLAAYQTYDQTIAAPGIAARARVAAMSQEFWDIAGVRAVVGRLPNPGEPDVVVLTDSFHKRFFAGDPTVVGNAVTVDRRQVTIVGVLPRSFHFQLPTPVRPGFRSRDIELYRVMAVPPRQAKFVQLLTVIGRLKSDVSIDAARSEINSIRARTPRGDPLFDNASLHVVPLHERLIRDSRVALTVVLVAVIFVSLVACANVATLLMAGATAREKEMAVRVAIGADGGRLLRQHLTESLIYLALGGTAALLVAQWAVSTANAVSLGSIPRLSETTIDGRTFAVTAVGSVVIAIVLAALQVLTLRSSHIQTFLKDAAHTTSATPAHLRGRRVIVTVEIAIAMMLLTGAGLMVKSFWKMNTFPPGFEPERILVMRVDFPGQPSRGQASREQKRMYTDELLRRVEVVRGVEAASINSHGDSLSRLNVEGMSEVSSVLQTPAALNVTSEAFAEVMGLRLVRGRWFTDVEPNPVVVLNESLALRAFGTSDPIGRRIQIPSTTGVPADVRFAPIVGVVADQKYTKLDEAPAEEFYVPYQHVPDLFRINLVVKTARDPLALASSIRQTILEFDNGQAPFDVMTLEHALADSIRPRRFNLLLLGTFAGTALLLALVGIYGVIAYSVAQRTHEIGIRMALGAQRAEVVAMVVRQGMRMTITGVIVGLVGAFMLTRLMVSLLYEVKAADPQTFAAVSAALGATALTAALVPALKAALVDPLVALRCE